MKNLIFRIISYSGIPWIMREFVNPYRVTILCFHNPSAKNADEHYKSLKRAYNIISLKEYSQHLAGKSDNPLPKKSLIITLDDGLMENYELLPVLVTNKIQVTIFACSSIIGTHRHYWWRKLSGNVNSAELELIKDNLRVKELKEIGFTETQEFEQRQALSIEEIEQLKEYVDFQSHTRFHPALPQCDIIRARDEIGFSKKELEDKIGIDIYAIAFPNGRYSDREIEIVKQCGYQCSLTTDEGLNDVESDPYRLKRIDIPDDVGINELLVKASGIWGLFKKGLIQ